MQSTYEQLGRIDIFAGLTPQAIALVEKICSLEELDAGQTVFRQGDRGDKLYLIAHGRVRISRQLGSMGEEALAVLGPGDVFGEMALLDQSVRSADAHVHERCELISISREAFEDLLFMHKDLAYEVLWNVTRTLCRRLRDTNDKVAFLSTTARF